MQTDNIKFKGIDCFKNDWVGLDRIEPINVIIGKNNTGKSRFLELIEKQFCQKPCLIEADVSIKLKITDEIALACFPDNKLGGYIDPYHHGHWEAIGKHINNKIIEIQYVKNGEDTITTNDFLPDSITDENRISYCRGAILHSANRQNIKSSITDKKYIKISAERDITPEPKADKANFNPKGQGLTNTLRDYYLHSKRNESLIHNELLDGLKLILGKEHHIKGIQIKLIEDVTDKYEVFLTIDENKNPLSRCGSGLKTIIHLLACLHICPDLEKITPSNIVFAFEELENNLHPSVIRRLYDYLIKYVEKHKCHVFITTHSAIAIDIFSQRSDTQIIQLSMTEGSTKCNNLTNSLHISKTLQDLGYKPSELLQANGLIWVEGPSDRTYLNKFIEIFSDGKYKDGIHYQIVFYGGSLLADATCQADDEEELDYVNLFKINYNFAIICDSDKTDADLKLKPRVTKIVESAIKCEGHVWITECKEIENYIPGDIWAIHYNKPNAPDPTKYDSFPKAPKEGNYIADNFERNSFIKKEIALEISKHFTREKLISRFDLNEKITDLIKAIEEWNSY